MGQRLVPLLHLRDRACECRRWQQDVFRLCLAVKRVPGERVQELGQRGQARLQEPGNWLQFPT